MTTIAKPPLVRVFAVQLGILLALATAVAPLGVEQVLSVLIGGAVQVATSVYFARQAFRYRGAGQIGRTVHAMYRGEMGKIVLTAALLAMAFVFLDKLKPLTVMASYAVMVLAHALLTARVLKNHRY